MAIDYNPAGRPVRDSQMADLKRLHGQAKTQVAREAKPNYPADSTTPDPSGKRDTASLGRGGPGSGETGNSSPQDRSGERTGRGDND